MCKHIQLDLKRCAFVDFETYRLVTALVMFDISVRAVPARVQNNGAVSIRCLLCFRKTGRNRSYQAYPQCTRVAAPNHGMLALHLNHARGFRRYSNRLWDFYSNRIIPRAIPRRFLLVFEFSGGTKNCISPLTIRTVVPQ